MPKKIQVLPEALSQVIAAGEVIERPASVVKELMENAIDAAASEVVVELRAGGLQLIRVRDDGEGMEREDLPVALARHGTSKIRSLEDLYAIQTLGFRGEALPSIASVSHMAIVTRPLHSTTGTRVICEGGEIKALSDAGCPSGTEVTVKNLFFNIPVKRKFLKSVSLELRHCLAQFLRLSLAHPSLSFRFIHDGRLLHEHLKTEFLKVRIEAILGREASDQLQAFEMEDGGIHLSGWASLATYSRGNGDGISLYVNGRFVKDRMIFRAILEAYRHVIPQGRFPAVILFLVLPPSAVDVNVHPTKTEVKFKEPDRLFPMVVSALRLLHEPTVSPRDARKSEERREGGLPDAIPYSLPFRRWEGYPAGGVWEREKADFGVAEVSHREEQSQGPRPFRILGQVARTYIVYEDSEGVTFIDQHAAHERILYEKLKNACETKSLPVTRFLTPVLMECSAEEALMLGEHLQDLSAMGFEIDPAGKRIFAIRSIPALIDQEDPKEIIRKILEEGVFSGHRKGDESLQPMLITLSCHSAIRANLEMRREEMEALVKDLQAFSSSTTCPHGRPVFFSLRVNDLERQFKRNPR
jgi:DNA mismatch repair protein MutL